MIGARIATVALALATAAFAGCGHAGGRGAASAGNEFTGGGPVCTAFHPLLDLRSALSTSAGLGGSSPLAYLVDADEEIAHAELASRRLKDVRGPEARLLDQKIGRLRAALEARRTALGAATSRLEATYEKAEAQLEVAAMCKNVDQRDPSAPAAAKGKRRDEEGRSEDERARVRKTNNATLASSACEPAVRLWSAARQVDLISTVSSSSVASHLAELGLDKERGPIRDRLTVAIKEHAAELRRFSSVAAPSLEEKTEESRQLLALRSDVMKDLDALRLQCLQTMRVTDRIVGGDPEPRRVTVTVRPKWPSSVESLPGSEAEIFGSGFVVRWRAAGGQLETRIVTNNHVMSGAFEAEIFAGDTALADKTEPSSLKPKGWAAVLIEANPFDDVAILRLEPAAAKVFREGVSFRLTAVAEQEPVVAAGFPGVGIRPSFQVTRGIVSNAQFGAEGDDVDATRGFVQHTASIDPGNSGGPLFDGKGRLVGMNTFKIVGRENVGLAVPTSRIQQAMLHAEEKRSFDIKQAEASCNAVVSALSAQSPAGPAMTRFGLSVFEKAERPKSSRAAAYRERLSERPNGPIEEARTRAYGAVRTKVEEERGVRPFEVCGSVRQMQTGSLPRAFSATMKTRSANHELLFAEENGVLRLIEFR